MSKFYEEFKNQFLEWFEKLTDKNKRSVAEEMEVFADDMDGVAGDYIYSMNSLLGEYGWNYTKEIRKAIKEIISDDLEQWSFVDDFVDDIVYHMTGYDNAEGFFKDLEYGGCSSGMIGMFIYHSDCKKFYIQHIDDMENMKEELEEEMGEPIQNRNHQPHYTFMCWLCYEEFANEVARLLFEDDF